jgi:hypothetical protein
MMFPRSGSKIDDKMTAASHAHCLPRRLPPCASAKCTASLTLLHPTTDSTPPTRPHPHLTRHNLLMPPSFPLLRLMSSPRLLLPLPLPSLPVRIAMQQARLRQHHGPICQSPRQTSAIALRHFRRPSLALWAISQTGGIRNAPFLRPVTTATMNHLGLICSHPLTHPILHHNRMCDCHCLSKARPSWSPAPRHPPLRNRRRHFLLSHKFAPEVCSAVKVLARP